MILLYKNYDNLIVTTIQFINTCMVYELYTISDFLPNITTVESYHAHVVQSI